MFEKLCLTSTDLNGLNESILSRKDDAQAYDFTKKQIEQFVEGLINKTPTVAYSKEDALRDKTRTNIAKVK